MHFLLEDVPRSLQSKMVHIFDMYFVCVYKLDSKEITLWKTFQKTLGRLLGKSSNAIYARRLPTKSSQSLMPKSSAQSGTKE
ncbi:hypothetical protein Bca101_087856 [Brassica carinata]